MIDWPILSIVTFLPLVGVALILLIRGDDDIAQRNIRNIALFTTIVTFIVSLFIWAGSIAPTRASRWSKRANGSAA